MQQLTWAYMLRLVLVSLTIGACFAVAWIVVHKVFDKFK